MGVSGCKGMWLVKTRHCVVSWRTRAARELRMRGLLGGWEGGGSVPRGTAPRSCCGWRERRSRAPRQCPCKASRPTPTESRRCTGGRTGRGSVGEACLARSHDGSGGEVSGRGAASRAQGSVCVGVGRGVPWGLIARCATGCTGAVRRGCAAWVCRTRVRGWSQTRGEHASSIPSCCTRGKLCRSPLPPRRVQPRWPARRTATASSSPSRRLPPGEEPEACRTP